MPFDVRVEAHVAKSPEEVAGYMFDPRHDPEWITGIEHVDPPSTPVAVGTETHRLARFMGRRIDYVLRVKEYIPDRLLVMESVRAPFPMGVTYGVEPDALGFPGQPPGHRRIRAADAPCPADHEPADQTEPRSRPATPSRTARGD